MNSVVKLLKQRKIPPVVPSLHVALPQANVVVDHHVPLEVRLLATPSFAFRTLVLSGVNSLQVPSELFVCCKIFLAFATVEIFVGP